MRNFTHLKYRDRTNIERLLRLNYSPVEIAEILRVNKSTIYRELKRGAYIRVNSCLVPKTSYSSDLAQERYRNNLSAKGIRIKLGNDYALAEFIERRIVDDNCSPEVVAQEIKRNIAFNIKVCTKTIYNYIHKGVFFRISDEALPYKPKKVKKQKRIRIQRNISGARRIDDRPNINNRKEFGHWEIDTVIGRRNKGKCLLVLTERKTRKEMIALIGSKSGKEVVKGIKKLFKQFPKEKLNIIFKSITSDNGLEFANKSFICFLNKLKIPLFFCHPYSSWERGSNENNNKLIRRHIPKGMDMNKLKSDYIKDIEKWINDYPRKIFNFKSSNELFNAELVKI